MLAKRSNFKNWKKSAQNKQNMENNKTFYALLGNIGFE